MFKFEELNVYKETLKFIEDAYLLSAKFPKEEMFGLTSQLRRAAVSIVLNIAEGSSRTRKDFQHFLSISRGSCFECVAILSISICINRQYINNSEYRTSYEICEKLSKMITKLKKFSLLKKLAKYYQVTK